MSITLLPANLASLAVLAAKESKGWKLQPIADRFGITETTVREILKGLIWRHVP